jgi:plasmid stabilization system protein ParE
MARIVKWTKTASEDLREAAEFIARDSPYYAASFVRQVRKAALSLDHSPERGRIVPESERTDIREIYVKSYRLIYQVASDNVFILSFIHGARDLTQVLSHRGGCYHFIKE